MPTPSLLITDERAAYLERYHAPTGAALRLEAIRIMGGRCACCGEQVEQMLTFEHLKGRGSRESNDTRRSILRRICAGQWNQKKYAAFCYNCNQAKADGRECPHQAIARALFWQNVA